MPAALKGIDWTIVQQLYASGKEELSSISQRFNIPLESIRSRAKRGKWADEKRRFMEAENAASLRPKLNRVEPVNRPIPILEKESEPDLEETASVSAVHDGSPARPVEIGDDWDQNRQKARSAAWRKAHPALEKATIQPPKTWKDLDIADKMQRRAAGLDDGEGPKVLVLVNMQVLNVSVRQVKRE